MNSIVKAGWLARLKMLDLLVPPNRGALWSGLDKAMAQEIACIRDVRTLEMTLGGRSLDSGLLKKKLDDDFGSEWNEDKKMVWLWASAIFATRLTGNVLIFLRADMYHSRASDASYLEKIVWDEFMDIGLPNPLQANGRVTTVTVLEFDRCGKCVSTLPLRQSGKWH